MISFKKDKRVDRFLKKKGYQPDDCKIFYSPISMWFPYFFLFLLIGFQVILFLIGGLIINVEQYFGELYGYLALILYPTISYLIAASKSHSFAVTDSKLLIINRNFPFRHFKEYKLSGIKEIKAGRKNYWVNHLFAILHDNYIEIYDSFSSEKYFCIFLEEDDFYAESMKGTIDELIYILRAEDVKIDYQLH